MLRTDNMQKNLAPSQINSFVWRYSSRYPTALQSNSLVGFHRPSEAIKVQLLLPMWGRTCRWMGVMSFQHKGKYLLWLGEVIMPGRPQTYIWFCDVVYTLIGARASVSRYRISYPIVRCVFGPQVDGAVVSLFALYVEIPKTRDLHNAFKSLPRLVSP